MAYILPVLIIVSLLIAVRNKTPVYQLFLEGAEDGIKMLFSILPPMIAVLSMAAMLKASGLLGAVTSFLAPFTQKIGIPSEMLPLALLRPFSGGGALGLLTDTIKTYGADSRISRAACILCASTETTFYTISVYFGAAKVRSTRHAVPAALIADLTGFVSAALAVRLFFPNV